MFFKITDDRYINLSQIRSIEYSDGFTKLFFSGAAHDAIKLPGDLRADILKAVAK